MNASIIKSNTLEDNCLHGLRIEESDGNKFKYNVSKGSHGECLENHDGQALAMMKSSSNIFKENRFSENTRGAVIHNSNSNEFEKNYFLDNTRTGIHVLRSNDNEFRNNEFSKDGGMGEWEGILVTGVGNSLTRNKVSNYNRGITVTAVTGSPGDTDWWGPTEKNKLINNTITNTLGGIVIGRNSKNTKIKHNTSKNNGRGILLWRTEDNKIIDNTLKNNEAGIVFWESNNNVVARENSIKKNKFGVLYFDAPSNKIFGYNEIKYNEIGIYLPTGTADNPNDSPNNVARCNTIAGNSEYGVLNEMDYESNPDYYFDARYNWWVPPPTGAENKGRSSKGKINKISDGVLVKPILKKPPEQSPHCPFYASETTTSSDSIQKEGLSVQGFQVSSNPVVSNEKVTFEVNGEGVNQVKVAVFNLNGDQLYDSGFVSGHSVSWNATTRSGQPLSNGIYLFRMVAKGSGELVKSGVRKLLVIK